MEVILAFVRDYNVNGEYHVWNVYSEYTADEQIEKTSKMQKTMER